MPQSQYKHLSNFIYSFQNRQIKRYRKLHIKNDNNTGFAYIHAHNFVYTYNPVVLIIDKSLYRTNCNHLSLSFKHNPQIQPKICHAI